MDKQTLEKMATNAFENQRDAKNQLYFAAEHAIESKQELEAAKAAAFTGGVIKGTNDKMRDAEMRDHLQAEYHKLETADKAERLARHTFDMASIEVDTVKTLLRIAELTI